MYFVYKEISNVYRNDFYNSLVNFSREIDQAIDVSLLLQTSLNEEIDTQERKIFPFSLKDAFVVVRNDEGRVLAFNGTEKVPNLIKNITQGEFNRLKMLGPGSYTIEKIKIKNTGYFYQINYFSKNRFERNYLIQILVSSSYLREDNSRILAKLMLWLPLLGGFVLLATYLLFRFSLLPVERLNNQIESAKLHHFSQDLLAPQGLPDVLEKFIKNINNLIKRLNANIKNQELFIAYASHQIKTPLTLISGLSQQLKSTLKNKGIEDSEEVDDIIQSSKDLNSILDKLMLLISLNDKRNLVFGEIDLLDVVTNIIDEFETLIQAKKLEFEIQADDSFDYMVSTEKDLLKMMLSNLIHNAIKYSFKETKIKLILSMREFKTSDHIYIEIQNTGKTIPPHEWQNIKQAFYRSSNSTGIEGSGLGLSIVERISVILDIPYELSPVEEGFRTQVWIKNS